MRYVLYRTDVKYIRIMHIREVKKHRKALFMLSAGNVSLPKEDSKTDMRTEEKQNILALQERISQLEKSLEYERLRVAAYERLIEIVKQEDGIDVLKKDGAKQ